MFQRILNKRIAERLFKGKTIVLIGARQVGKTTLIREILSGKDYLFLDGDEPLVRQRLTNPNTIELATLIGNADIVFIDEAQMIENIGLKAKIPAVFAETYQANVEIITKEDFREFVG